MKPNFYQSVLLIILPLVVCCKEEVDFENYQPIQEFAPAYEAISQKWTQTDSLQQYSDGDVYYDIEETVRIMNGLEMAQGQSDDFYEFLKYMAMQDYSLVAPDVLRAKARILPILQQMYVLEKQEKSLGGIYGVVRSIGKGIEYSAINNNIDIDIADMIDIAGMSIPIGIVKYADSSINDMRVAAFESFKQERELKKSLQKQIEGLKMAYLDYLTEYSPIYHKYMKEWDRLCIDKDKAYLDAYSGRMIDAYNSSAKILETYPNNREALLLKSLSLIKIAENGDDDRERILELGHEIHIADTESRTWNKFYIEADLTLDNYMNLYPNRSAPALVLKGMLNYRLGKEKQALSYFDQAAIEYPRQAAALTDMLDSYRSRTYLNKTQEGQYLLRLYRSTMEGYGLFSPNFIKAHHYAVKGDLQKSKEEIYNHFFRRGNQGIYDCLLSDMQFCEENLSSSFKQLFVENSFVDVYISPETGWFGSDLNVNVTLVNRTDIELENVRIFLCLHYTDMYVDEYEVIKVPSKNIVSPYSSVAMGTVSVQQEGKTYNDITRVRAIAMTDNQIFWIDDPHYKEKRVLDASVTAKNLEIKAEKIRNEFLKDFSLNVEKLTDVLKKNTAVINSAEDVNDQSEAAGQQNKLMKFISDIFGNKVDTNADNKNLIISMPRILSLLEPVFLIRTNCSGENISHSSVFSYVGGSEIIAEFDYAPQMDEAIVLLIYSKFVNFRVALIYKGKESVVKNVEIL